MQRTSRAYFAITLVLAMGAWAGAADPTSQTGQKFGTPRAALPSFRVTDAAGAALDSGQFQRGGKWLLIYLNADCRRCDSLLQAVSAKTVPASTKKIVVVVGKIAPNELKHFTARYGTEWQRASWYADSEGQAFSKLKLAGVPVALGMRDNRIEWLLNAPGPSMTYPRSALNTWLK